MTSILESLNNDLYEIHRYYEALGFKQVPVDTDKDVEYWKTSSDRKGKFTFTILSTPKGYKIHGWSAAHSGEAGTEQDVDRSFSDCIMSREGIDARELARRYADKYGDNKGQRKGRDKPSPFAVGQVKPKPDANGNQTFLFPGEIKLDEDALILQDGAELKQDPLMPNVYVGELSGDLVENIAFQYEQPPSLLYRVKFKNGEKDIRQYSFNAVNGRFIKGRVDNKNRCLFNEQAVRSAEVVVYVEGEKCVYDLQRFFLEHGVNVAVVTAGSCGNVNADIIRETLDGKPVYILPDNDPGGYKCALSVKTALLGTGSEVQVFQWNDNYAEAYDISNLLEDDKETLNNADDLTSFFAVLEESGAGVLTDGTFLSDYEKKEDTAEAGGDKPKKLRLRTITAKDLVNKKLPPKKMLLSPWLREGTLAIVSAPTGVGKSWFSLTVAKAVSEGTNAFDNRWKASEASRVLYIDGEMEDVDIQERLNILGIKNENFILHTIETDTDDVLQINVGQLEWQEVIIDEIKELKISLLILDNVFTLYDTGEKSNTQEYWKPMQSFILKLRAIGVAVLLVDHEGKNREIKSAMGTAAKAFVLNATFTLSHPDDYQMEEGARFNVEMGKARNLKGRDTVPFIATLQESGEWDTVDKSELDAHARDRYSEELERIREDFREGLIPVQIQSDVIKQGDIAKLYNKEMPEIIRSEFNNDREPLNLEEALKKYEPLKVRLAYLQNNPNRQGGACVELIEAGQAEADVLKTYRAINGKDADRPEEVVRYSAECKQKAEAELRRKYYILLIQGKAKEYFEGDKELKNFSYTSMCKDLTRSYFTEKNAELIPLALRQGDELPPLCLVWLRNEASGGYYPCEPNFDETEMCRIYVETARDESQKKRRLETLRTLRSDDRWKKAIGRLAKTYEIKLDPKQVGRPKKSGQTSSDEKDSEKES